MLFLFFNFLFSKISLKFINGDGIQIENLENLKLHSNFTTIINLDGFKIFLIASNNQYRTNLNLFEDPCLYKFTGIFNKAKGYFNICDGLMEFQYLKKKYKMILNEDNEIIYKSEDLYDRGLLDTNVNMNLNTNFNTNFNMNSFVPYKIDIFIFNNTKRVKRLQNSINNNTLKIFNTVTDIFYQSKMNIEPKIIGILNMNDPLIENDDILHSFKNTIEPIRFSPFNLYTPLSNSDLVILLYEHDSITNIHGLSYYGGSSKLDSSYSVVFSNPEDSTYFIAKKIAHEIGHSLGATHDGNSTHNSIMEKVSCINCENEKRYFSDFSKNQIYQFIKNNRKLFNKRNQLKYEDDKVLLNQNEADEYADERRKHSFESIIKSRLGGRIPVEGSSEFLIFMMMIIYSLSVLMILYYWK